MRLTARARALREKEASVIDRVRSWILVVAVLAGIAGLSLRPTGDAYAQAAPAAAQAALAQSLIEFEGATRWESLRPAWRSERDAWVAAVRSASTPAQLAALAIRMETIMTWESMARSWRRQRAGWLARTRASTSAHDVAQSLIALETATTWAAMYEDRWRAQRAGWVSRLQSL